MAANNDETTGQLHREKTPDGENNYFYIDATAVMLAIAYENRLENRPKREMVEMICESATALLESGAAMGNVADWVDRENAGRCSLLGRMAQIMREYCEVRK